MWPFFVFAAPMTGVSSRREDPMMLTSIRRAMAAHFWSKHHEAEDLVSWMHEPTVRRYINESVTGSPHCWPMQWLRDRIGRTLDWGLSVGCGLGALERDILDKEICRRVVGVDNSEMALAKAEDLARQGGFEGVEYYKGDFNTEFWDRDQRFDIVFFHQAMHHVEGLETCIAHIADILGPGGLLFLEEYVGPSRADWAEDMLDEANRVYRALPAKYRRRKAVQLPVDWRDPSEAVRSAEIMPLVAERFETLERRDYGGNLVALIYPHLALHAMDDAAKEQTLLELIEAERQLLSAGAPSFYTLFLGEPRQSSPAPR